MASWLHRITQLYDVWAIQASVLCSFGLHVLLILFAEIRRRRATDWRRFFLWLAYQLVDSVAKYFLSRMSLRCTPHEQQLLAFWATFLLLHLGRPDNISAYTLEDNVLSGRLVIEVFLQSLGAWYVIWKHIPLGGGGTLFPAAWIMFAVGLVKYVERIFALWRGDLGSIRSSGEKHKPRCFNTGPSGGQELDDEQALLVAHRLFRISKGAFADYSVVKDPLKRPDGRDRQSFPHGWKGMRMVVEMELSLMYDILYTKAAMVHTWGGYLLRFVSPPLTAVAFLLFWFYSKDGQRRVDIVITYILLAATFILDTRWLLGALGSTWTYAFLNDRPGCWLHHKLLCTGRWHRLHRVVVSPCRLLGKEPASYRKWSGTIGQYNLLHECTHDTESLCRTLAKKVGLEDSWNEYQYHYWRGHDISKKLKKLLFDRIWQELEKQFEEEEYEPLACVLPDAHAQLLAQPYDAHLRRTRRLDEALGFFPEIGEQILALHIATDVFLLCSDQNAAPFTCVKAAIKALSNYMMFLVAVRPYMVPGLTLSSLHKATRDALKDIRRCSSTTREKELACKLLGMQENRTLYGKSIILSDGTRYAQVLLRLLQKERWNNKDVGMVLEDVGMQESPKKREKFEERLKRLIPGLWQPELWQPGLRPPGLWQPELWQPELRPPELWQPELRPPGLRDNKDLLDIIFDAWVRMLIFVSIRCSRDSHAKQLSRGGELTTIVWILTEHAGIFHTDN